MTGGRAGPAGAAGPSAHRLPLQRRRGTCPGSAGRGGVSAFRTRACRRPSAAPARRRGPPALAPSRLRFAHAVTSSRHVRRHLGGPRWFPGTSPSRQGASDPSPPPQSSSRTLFPPRGVRLEDRILEKRRPPAPRPLGGKRRPRPQRPPTCPSPSLCVSPAPAPAALSRADTPPSRLVSPSDLARTRPPALRLVLAFAGVGVLETRLCFLAECPSLWICLFVFSGVHVFSSHSCTKVPLCALGSELSWLSWGGCLARPQPGSPTPWTTGGTAGPLGQFELPLPLPQAARGPRSLPASPPSAGPRLLPGFPSSDLAL